MKMKMMVCHHPRHCLPVQRITWYVFCFFPCWMSEGLLSDVWYPTFCFFFVLVLTKLQDVLEAGADEGQFIFLTNDLALRGSTVGRERKWAYFLYFSIYYAYWLPNWWPCNRSFVPGDFEWWELSRQRTGPEPFDHDEILLGQLFYTVWYLIWCHQCK